MEIKGGAQPAGEIGEQTRRKLEAFARIEVDFVASFSFVQDVHGRHRYEAFPITYSVRYLHALYVCECKDRLLSIPKHNSQRYEGVRCLELLRDWQEGQTSAVVAFLHRKLDEHPFGELTRQIEAAHRAGDAPLARRLTSGRTVLLNRTFNLSHALDAMFALDPERLRAEVRAACEQVGHSPDAIERQLAELQSDLYAYAPSAALARINMLVMNRLAPYIMNADGDRPGERTDRVRLPASPEPSYAEEVIAGEMTLISMGWNNPRHVDLANPPLQVDAPDTLARDPVAPPDATEPIPGTTATAQTPPP